MHKQDAVQRQIPQILGSIFRSLEGRGEKTENKFYACSKKLMLQKNAKRVIINFNTS